MMSSCGLDIPHSLISTEKLTNHQYSVKLTHYTVEMEAIMQVYCFLEVHRAKKDRNLAVKPVFHSFLLAQSLPRKVMSKA